LNSPPPPFSCTPFILRITSIDIIFLFTYMHKQYLYHITLLHHFPTFCTFCPFSYHCLIAIKSTSSLFLLLYSMEMARVGIMNYLCATTFWRLFVVVVGTGVWNPATFLLDRLSTTYVSDTPNPFGCSYFSDRVLSFCPWQFQPSNCLLMFLT
jgi:hypothetical protein